MEKLLQAPRKHVRVFLGGFNCAFFGGGRSPFFLEGLTFSEKLTIFPSPASSNMTVSLDGIKGNNRCQIYSITGKKVLEFVLENNTRTLDVSNLANGTYILAVNTDQGAVKQAFVIAK